MGTSMRAALLAASVPFIASCTLLPVGGSVTSPPGGHPSPMGDGLRDFRASFHCHSYLSHDCEGTVEEIAGAAKELGLNVVLLTDHYEPGNFTNSPRGLYEGVLIIPGLETGTPNGGSMMAVAPAREFSADQPFASRRQQLKDDGALLVAGHTEEIDDDYDLEGFVGFEVYNLHAEFRDIPWWKAALRFLFLFPDPFFEHSITTPKKQLDRWDRELKKRRLAPLAGHDAHANVRAFGSLGGTIGTYGEVFRLFSTRILASELTEKAILEALGRRHVYVVFDYLADPAGFSLKYGAPGGEWAIPGDSARYSPDYRLVVNLPQECRLRLLRDGEEMIAEETFALETPLPGPGTYRLEAHLDDRLWILTSPLYLAESDTPPKQEAGGEGCNMPVRRRSESKSR